MTATSSSSSSSSGMAMVGFMTKAEANMAAMKISFIGFMVAEGEKEF